MDNTIFNSEAKKKIDCNDIYIEETNREIKALKDYIEIKLNSSESLDTELFQYADADFNFYRYVIRRQEASTEYLLKRILPRIMDRYGVKYDIPVEGQGVPFVFSICGNDGRTAFRFKDFFIDDDINRTLDKYFCDKAIIIRTYKSGEADKRIVEENRRYQTKEIRLKAISLMAFFDKFLCHEEYLSFVSYIERYLQEARETIGYKTIKTLSSFSYVSQKAIFEKDLAEWDYYNYSYQIVDKNKKKIQKNVKRLSINSFSDSVLQTMGTNYVSGKLYSALVGINDYAESFITAEWLYYSLKDKNNFDYTPIISGYVKSIEQLIHKIIMINIDNGCKITIDKNKINDAKSNNINAYTFDEKEGFKISEKGPAYNTFIDLTTTQTEYMDRSLGTYEYFIRNNKHIFIEEECAKIIADMIGCFRDEYRNGYFHIHNLKNWDIVEKTRSNAIYLYFVLLGGCVIPNDKVPELGIRVEDEFDELCKRIRNFTNYSVHFIFEYANGKKENMFYDFINNSIEITDDGIEHYEGLIFYKLKDFSLNSIEGLNHHDIREHQKVYLSRDNLPERIYGVYKKIDREKFDKDLERLL